jgi:hypothetical protein
MKIRKAILLLTLISLAVLVSGQADAGPEWYECIVDKVGPYGIIEGTSGSWIYLTHNDPDPAWDGSKKFIIHSSRGKEYLDIGSKAMLAFPPKLVEAYVDPEASNPLVKGLLLKSANVPQH